MIPDPVLLIVVPLIAAFLVPVVRLFSKRVASYIPFIGMILATALAAWILTSVDGGAVRTTTGGFDPPWGISLVVTSLGAIMALAMFAIGTFVSLGYAGRTESVESWGAVMTMMATTGAVGMVITGDLFNLFVFLEITSIAATVMAALPRGENGKGLNWQGAAHYAVISSVASALVLTAIALIYSSTSTLNLAQIVQRAPGMDPFVSGTVLLLLFVGFGIEAEIFPLNGWAREVYRGSRWGTSSLFSTVVGKASLVALVRLIVLVVEPAMGNDFPSELMVVAGIVTYLVGEAGAFTSKDLYRMMGFSSIGMFGLITAAFGVGGESATEAAMMLVLGHLLVKPVLFSLVDHAGRDSADDIPLKRIDSLLPRSPVSGAFFIISLLALIGLPPSPIFWGKFLLFQGAGSATEWALVAAVLIGTLLEAGYVGRLVWRIVRPAEEGAKTPLPWIKAVPGALLLLLVILLGIVPIFIGQYMEGVVSELTDPNTYIGWGVFP